MVLLRSKEVKRHVYKGHFTQTENETDIEKISIHSTGMATVHLNKAEYGQSGLERYTYL